MLKSLNCEPDTPTAAGAAQSWHGRVYARDGDRYGVAGAFGGYWVAVAASCLLQPAPGDQVLVSMTGQQGYILAVLEQADASQSELHLPGNAQLLAAQGTLTVAARDGLKLAGGAAVMLDAPTVRLATPRLDVHARTMRVTGDTRHSIWRERHDVAHTHSSVVARIDCRVHDRVTRISGHDELAAGSQRIVVQGDWRVRARHADVRASQRASVDAAQVQIG